MLNRPGENPDCNDLISLWEWGGTGGNYMGDYIENEEKLDKKVNKSDISYLKTSRVFDVLIHSGKPNSVG